MAVSPEKILAWVQILKIGASVVEAYQKGDLTDEEEAEAKAQVQERVSTAHDNWDASMQSPAAQARRDET